VGLERGPLSLVSPIEELLERKSSGSCLENREYGHRDPLHLPRDTLYPQKVGNDFADKRQSVSWYSRSRTQALSKWKCPSSEKHMTFMTPEFSSSIIQFTICLMYLPANANRAAFCVERRKNHHDRFPL
jgi:hypothetical protein